MSDTLRDQLLGLGFKPAPKPERKPERKPHDPSGKRPPHPAHAKKGGQPGQGRPGSDKPSSDRRGPGKPGASKPQHGGKPRSQGEIDLAKAYAIRAQKEKDERIEA